MPCEVCDVLLDTREAMPYVMGHRHFNSAICIINLKAELAEWRTGKRRVYWYIKHSDGSSWPLGGYVDRDCRKLVNAQLMSLGGPRKAMRVTVGPRGNVRPWVKR